MKKRFLSIVLAGALAATALVGCGKGNSDKPAGNDPTKENEQPGNTDATGVNVRSSGRAGEDASIQIRGVGGSDIGVAYLYYLLFI